MGSAIRLSPLPRNDTTRPGEPESSASGGAVAPFRYVVVFNQTAPNDELVAFFDKGEEVTLADGETFTVNFGAALFTLA